MWCLGIGGGYFHDASACLFKDGELIVYIEEERLTRVRHALGMRPNLCIQACLEAVGITLQEIDVVAIAWNPYFPQHVKELDKDDDEIKKLFPPSIFGNINAQIIVVDHQLAHASSAYRTSGEDCTLVLSVDGFGDGKSLGVYRGEMGQLQELECRDITQSLGWFYEIVTMYIGVGKWQHAGKTMALSTYGIPCFEFDFIEVDGDFRFSHPHTLKPNEVKEVPTLSKTHYAYYLAYKEFLFEYFSSLGVPQGTPSVFFDRISGDRIHKEPTKQAINLAASAQKVLEDAMVSLVSTHLHHQQLESLCIAGGVAMNCIAMGKLLDQIPSLKRIYIPPVAGDMGGAVGAALEALSTLKVCSGFKFNHAYWGYDYSDEEIENLLSNLGLNFIKVPSSSEYAAELISKGFVVGWFQGRMEVGARALGNRSILALPSGQKIKDRINSDIKNRELWRPFSPSILPGDFLQKGWLHSEQASPFMTIALQGTDASSHLDAIQHIDGTSRMQMVISNGNNRFSRLVDTVEKITGTPVVLNTSLNGRDEPIACRPVDALRLFATTSIDALFLGSSLLLKENIK